MVESPLLIPLAPRDLNEAAAQEVLAMGLLHGTANGHTPTSPTSWRPPDGPCPHPGRRQLARRGGIGAWERAPPAHEHPADVLTGPAHRDAVVPRPPRDRARTQIIATRSQPGHIAAEALLDHPLWSRTAIERHARRGRHEPPFTPDSVRAAHSGRSGPDHADPDTPSRPSIRTSPGRDRQALAR